jgi:hypothetical protein
MFLLQDHGTVLTQSGAGVSDDVNGAVSISAGEGMSVGGVMDLVSSSSSSGGSGNVTVQGGDSSDGQLPLMLLIKRPPMSSSGLLLSGPDIFHPASLSFDANLAQRSWVLSDADISDYVTLTSYEFGEDLLFDHHKVDMTQAKMSCLAPGRQLNDEVINLFMFILQERNNTQGVDPTHYFNTFFMAYLLQNYSVLYTDSSNRLQKKIVTKNSYDFDAIKRWTKKFVLHDNKYTVVPINITDTHWTLLIVTITNTLITMTYYDSMGAKGEIYTNAMKRYLIQEFSAKNNGQPLTAEFQVLFGFTHVQRNCFDCGMYLLLIADLLSDSLSVSHLMIQ